VKQIKDHAGHQELERYVVAQLMPLAFHRADEVVNHRPHRNQQHHRKHNRDRLQPLRNRPVNHVMRARPDIDKGQRPETDHRKFVAIERTVRGFRNEVIRDGESDWREDQADGVVFDQLIFRVA
jgi:hypothetical protein